ncbi:MAG: A/G-specific adenine glycosylase [Candidatus Binatia bacterium]
MLPKLRSAIRRKLARWYEINKRDLPWRRSHDPYAIWISETMLQQTQVNTVIPYYKKFLDHFPTIDALARAPLPQVLRLWSGLGYYRRAANLRKAGRQIVRGHAGKIPQDFAQLRALAGIGDYTAGALLSIAFGKAYPAIDGNVRRVLSRLLRITDEGKLRAIAAELVPAKRPGEFNQAIMELGATVCTPKNQRCSDCALNSLCASRSSPDVSALGSRTPLKFRTVIWPLAIVRRGGKILLRRRGANGLMAGLWELPGQELTGQETIAGLFKRELNALRLPRARPTKLGEIRHAITYRRIRAPIYLLDLPAKTEVALPRSHWRWVAPAKLQEHAISSMTAKAVGLLSAHEKNFR